MNQEGLTLKPIGGRALLLENGAPRTGGVLVESGVWSPFLDYVVLRAPRGADYGPGDRVVLRYTESGRKVSVDGIACRTVPAEDIVAVVEER